MDGPEAEQAGVDGPEGEQARQRELDGPEAEQVGLDGPEGEQGGQAVGSDGAVPAGIGADQQNQQGERPRDPLEDRLDQDRADNQRHTGITADSINGVDTRGQQLPEGVYTGSAQNLRIEGHGGNDQPGQEADAGEGRGRPNIQFAGGTVDGVQLPSDRSVNLEEFEQLRAAQSGSTPAAGATASTPSAETLSGGARGGMTPGQQHAQSMNRGGGRDNEGAGREPSGR